MSKRKYKVGGLHTSYKTMQKILSNHRNKEGILSKVSQGKTVKTKLDIKMVDKVIDDGYESLGERQAYSMYGI